MEKMTERTSENTSEHFTEETEGVENVAEENIEGDTKKETEIIAEETGKNKNKKSLEKIITYLQKYGGLPLAPLLSISMLFGIYMYNIAYVEYFGHSKIILENGSYQTVFEFLLLLSSYLGVIAIIVIFFIYFFANENKSSKMHFRIISGAKTLIMAMFFLALVMVPTSRSNMSLESLFVILFVLGVEVFIILFIEKVVNTVENSEKLPSPKIMLSIITILAIVVSIIVSIIIFSMISITMRGGIRNLFSFLLNLKFEQIVDLFWASFFTFITYMIVGFVIIAIGYFLAKKIKKDNYENLGNSDEKINQARKFIAPFLIIILTIIFISLYISYFGSESARSKKTFYTLTPAQSKIIAQNAAIELGGKDESNIFIVTWEDKDTLYLSKAMINEGNNEIIISNDVSIAVDRTGTALNQREFDVVKIE